MRMMCMGCNEIWDVSEVEGKGECPDCGCDKFYVFLEDEVGS